MDQQLIGQLADQNLCLLIQAQEESRQDYRDRLVWKDPDGTYHSAPKSLQSVSRLLLALNVTGGYGWLVGPRQGACLVIDKAMARTMRNNLKHGLLGA